MSYCLPASVWGEGRTSNMTQQECLSDWGQHCLQTDFFIDIKEIAFSLNSETNVDGNLKLHDSNPSASSLHTQGQPAFHI